jgi:LysM repeat protein
VTNKHLLAAYVIKVANMNYLQVGLEFKFLKSQEDELSAKAKVLSEDAHREYGQHIPLDIRMDIDAAVAEVTDYKNKKAIVIGQIEYFEAQEKEDDWNGMNKDWEEDDSNSFEEVLKRNVMNALLWVEKRYKKISLTFLSLAACLLLLTAVISTKDDMPAPSHKAPEDTVVVDKPVDKGTAPVVDNKDENNTPAPVEESTETTPSDTNVVTTKDEVHTVVAGDTLWDMAVKAYGDGAQWTKIYAANKDKLVQDDTRNITDAGHWIHEGQTIIIPGGSN